MTPAQYNEYQRMADVIHEANKWQDESKYFISDEEIMKKAIEHSELYTLKFVPRNAFIQGAKWYREQLKKKQ